MLLNVNYWDLSTGNKSEQEYNHQTTGAFKDIEYKDISLDIDDKIISLTLAGDLDS